MSAQGLALLVLLGCAGGFSAGLLGIGGGMVLVPFLTALLTAAGFAPSVVVHMAIATALSTIVLTSLSSMSAHHRRGAVLWPVAVMLAPGIVVGAWAGAQIASALPTFGLALFFAVFVGLAATQMWLDRPVKPHRTLPGRAGLMTAGALIGAMASAVGAGGGFLTVPFLVWCNVRMHNAVATSAAMGFPIALAGTIGFVMSGWNTPDLPHCSAQSVPMCSLGYVYLPALIACASTSVLFAPLGARVAHALDVRPLRRAFAGLLYSLALYMLYKAWASGPLLG